MCCFIEGLKFFFSTFMGDLEHSFVHIFKSYKYKLCETNFVTECIIIYVFHTSHQQKYVLNPNVIWQTITSYCELIMLKYNVIDSYYILHHRDLHFA